MDVNEVDATAKGVRCVAVHKIANVGGAIDAQTQGTIICEFEAHGSDVINVYWDTGINSLVSPGQIAIMDDDIVWQ
jgi:hypothetical protein